MNTTRRAFIKSTFGLASVSLVAPSLLLEGSSVLAQQLQSPLAPGARQLEPGVIAAQSDRWAVVPFESLNQPKLNYRDRGHGGQLTDFVQLYTNEPATRQTLVLLAYDEAQLHLKIIATGAKNSTPVFEQLDLILSTDPRGGSFYQIPIPLSDTSTRSLRYSLEWDKNYPDPQRVSLNADAYSVKVIGDPIQYTVEVSIPFKSLNVQKISPGDEWRFNVIRYRDDESPFSMWAPVRYSMFDGSPGKSYSAKFAASHEGRMGSLFFGRIPIEKFGTKLTPWATPSWPSRWNPKSFALRYKTYTEKQIELSLPNDLTKNALIHFKWRAPAGEMSSIDSADVHVEGKVLSGTIHHPRPAQKGTYQLFVIIQDAQNSYFTILSFDDQSLIEAGESLYHFALPSYPVTQIAAAPASKEVQQWLAVIPDKIGFRFTGVPGSSNPTVDRMYTWDIDQPDQLKTVDGGQVFPNPQYPENHAITVKNKLGEDVVYPYYQDAKGERYFVSAHRWWQQKEQALRFTSNLREQDILGAARLLYRWAQLYPGYVSVYDWPRNNFPVDARKAPPHPRNGGIFSRWHYGDLLSMKGLVDVFDAARRTNALEILSKETGENVEQKIIDNMFLPEIDFANSYNITNSNVDYRNWIGYVALGRALNQPKYVHHAVDLLQTFHGEYYLSDGFWKEASISYHDQSTGGVEMAMASLKNWSDPPEYISPRTGDRYDSLNPQQKFPAVGKSLTVTQHLVYSNGHYLPTGDTWAASKSRHPVLTEKYLLVPAVGIGKFARGEGKAQAQLYMSFTPKYGHTHSDPLNINLFAKGQELLPDIGYTYVKYRRLYTSSFAHNTVVVDSSNMTGGKDGGNITAFAPLSENVQVMQAEESKAVAGTSEYRREVWFIGFDGADKSEGYAVDLFRVNGGDLHEYTLNGDANHNGGIDTKIPLTDYNNYYYPPGTKVTMPVNEYDSGKSDGKYFGYMMMRDVKTAPLPKSTFDLSFKSSTDDGKPLANLKVTGFVHGNGTNALFTGGIPSIRITRLGGKPKDKNTQLGKYPDTPKFVIKSAGKNLHNIFAAVMEPYLGNATKITSIESLRPDNLPEGAAIIKVLFGNTTDYILSAPHYSGTPISINEIQLHGKMGFIRLVDGKLQQMYLVGGTSLQFGTQELKGSGVVMGSISRTLRIANGDSINGFQTETPVASSLKGKYIIITHPDGKTHGYQITAISRDGNMTSLAIGDNDPGFEINEDGTSQLMFFPETSWAGTHTFSIDNSEALSI